MDLSIIVVNWNTRELTRACLDSVFSNIGDLEAEVILIDNASTDGSADLVEEEFPQVRLLRNNTNRGFAAANNQGFELAQGRYILMLNSDTLVHGRVLQSSVEYLDSRPSVGAMGCRVLNGDGSVQLTCHQFPSLLNQFLMAAGLWKLKRPRWFGRYLMTDWQRDSERHVDVITGCYLMFRRELLTEVGTLDENFFFFGEETDWCRRVSQAGWELRFAPVGEITHYGSASAKKLNHRRDLLLTASKVRLHRKYGGWTGAATCWLLAAMFNGSRAAYWGLRSLGGSQASKDRARHFYRVVAELGETWGRHA